MQFLVLTTSKRTARSRVLVESIRRQHPGSVVMQLWCDESIGAVPASDVVLPQRLEFGRHRWEDWILGLGSHLAGWAVLPWVIDQIATADDVVVIDDTFMVFGSLDGFASGGAPGVRAGHVDPGSGAHWGAPLGGLVLFPTRDPHFADWWKRMSIAVLEDPAEPTRPWWSSYSAYVHSVDPALRLSPSTAGGLDVTIGAGDEVLVDGRAIVAADFGVFQPTRPWWFPGDDGEPTALLSGSRGLRQLCTNYAGALDNAGWSSDQDDRSIEVVPGLVAGTAIRSWYRGLLREAAQVDDVGPPPNPFVPGGVRPTVELLAGPGAVDGTGVSLNADLLYESRPDLRGAFPSPRWRDRVGFNRWLWSSGLREGQVSLATLRGDPPCPAPAVETPAQRPFGVNLVGYMGSELGLGVAARRMKQALEDAGVPVSVVSYDRTMSSQRVRSDHTVDKPYYFNLMLIVPDQLPLFIGDVGGDFLDGHYNIGLWYWETDVLTDVQRGAFGLVDEVWAATTYLQRIFEKVAPVPVTRVPSPLVFERYEVDRSERERLGLDDRFTFLFSFDFLSIVERKNPLGLFDAYCRAFGPGDGTRLILKSINGSVFPEEKERLLYTISDRDDVELWDRLVSSRDRMALIAAADCYVSLHRSEGLGLTMAEAMASSTPVIATAYSGNLDFMDETSALLVPGDEILIGPGQHYPAGGHWADPDLGIAAQQMRRIRDDALMGGSLSTDLDANALRSLDRFGYSEVGSVASERLLEIWAAHRAQLLASGS